ncbi:MAG: flavin reductase family protein [Candidatus Aenigmarchaeota archaeon]|nr:flavin reductase family protein [Candidatus Aenigmarchaeota archaeon]
MDLPWGDERSLKFITNVGLITSDGPHGPNVMAAEWTHHVSYKPGYIAVCIGSGKATLENITKTKKFGVNITATGQSVMAHVAGNYSGKKTDKIGALKELGFTFYNGEKTGLHMVQGAALNAECKVIKMTTVGDHVMVIGEVLSASATDKEPVAYHKGMYWNMETPTAKPSEAERDHMHKIVAKHLKK